MKIESEWNKQINLSEANEDSDQATNSIEAQVKTDIANGTLQLKWEWYLGNAKVEEAGKYLDLTQQYKKKIDTSAYVYKKTIYHIFCMTHLSLEERLENIQAIIQFAKMRGQDIKLTNKDYQEVYERILYGGSYDKAKELANHLKQQGVEMVVTSRMIKKYFKGAFDEGIYLDEAQGAINLAKESGIKFGVPKRFLQKKFNESKQGDPRVVNQILEFAKENNIELE